MGGGAPSGAGGYGVEKEHAPGYLLRLAGRAAQGQAGGLPSWACGEAVWASTLDSVFQPGSLERWGKSDRPQLWGLEAVDISWTWGLYLGGWPQVTRQECRWRLGHHLPLHTSPRIQGFQGCQCWAVCSALGFTSSGACRC